MYIDKVGEELAKVGLDPGVLSNMMWLYMQECLTVIVFLVLTINDRLSSKRWSRHYAFL